VRSRAAISKELSSIIERHLQQATIETPKPFPGATSASIKKHFLEMIFNQKTYSVLFNAGTVIFD